MASQQVATGRQVIGYPAVTATGDIGSTDLGVCYSKFSLQTVVTGGPTGVSCTLQGSLDGTNYAVLATSTSTTGDLQTVADKPVRFIKVNLGTLTAGTSPTVTAHVGVA